MAKLSGAGLPEKLTVGEIASFTSYIDGLVYAGDTICGYFRRSGRRQIGFLEIVFDPLVLANDGSMLSGAHRLRHRTQLVLFGVRERACASLIIRRFDRRRGQRVVH